MFQDGEVGIAPGLGARYKAQKDFYNLSIGWKDIVRFPGYSRGDYSSALDDIIVRKEKLKTKKIPSETLQNREVFYARYLRQQIELKQGEPVIALDVGGGVGLSWIKLAKHFEKEVQEGKIAFVVTNLNYTPTDATQENLLTPEQQKFISDNHRLVQFCNAIPKDFRKIMVNFSNGKQIPLEGNADFINDRLSISLWGKTPEIDILRVAKLLSTHGAYFVSGFQTEDSAANEEQRQIAQGVVRAHSELERQGLVRVTRIEQGRLVGTDIQDVIFRKPGAIPILLNT